VAKFAGAHRQLEDCLSLLSLAEIGSDFRRADALAFCFHADRAISELVPEGTLESVGSERTSWQITVLRVGNS